MRFRRFTALALSLLAVGASFAGPAQAKAKAKETKKLTSTIAWWASDAGTSIGAGKNNAAEVPQVRQTCPKGGMFDGSVFRFFDLKGTFNGVKVTGPKPLVNQEAAGNTVADYDLDVFALDAKCKLVDLGAGVNSGGASEKGFSKKGFNYVVVIYWQGHTPNMPVNVEITRG